VIDVASNFTTAQEPKWHDFTNVPTFRIYQIGDWLEPRSAKTAISEAAEIGRAI